MLSQQQILEGLDIGCMTKFFVARVGWRGLAIAVDWGGSLSSTDPPGGEGGGGAKRSAEQLEAENAGLRREIEYLRQQRDILKKTLGILSEPPSNVFNGLTR